ncbi:MAG TPA: TrbI/VirB10 family protein [Allosphingosinicella sp.]|jgi:type IV secretion system protein VirB10
MALAPGSFSPDPRTLAPTPAEEGVRPVVAVPRQGLPVWALVLLAVLAFAILFAILDSRRRSRVEVTETTPQATGTAVPAPPLIVPGPVQQPMQMQPQPQPQYQMQPQPRIFVPSAPAPAPRYQPQVQSQPQIVYVPQPAQPQPQIPQAPQRMSGDPTLVIDTTAGGAGPTAAEGAAAAPAAPPGPGGGGAGIAGTRARAGSFANRTTTVPQGTLIPAVMETAFHSNRPGLARAIVSRDIRGFDGKRVLIPRGSRLVGEYRSDMQPGQRRALVNWIRLIRPDGVTIAIGSPSTDTLGRSGIRANVNTHFFQRFAGAILRSTVDLGLTLAAGAANTPLLVVPGGNPLQGLQTANIPPTLTVRPGASISVFVARDLDFTGSDRRR